jgi:hypothetical protein
MMDQDPNSALNPCDPDPVKKPRKWSVWVDGRLQIKLATAVDEDKAKQVVYEKWGIERSSKVTVKVRFQDKIGEDNSDCDVSAATPADALGFKLGRALARWTGRQAEIRIGFSAAQRIDLEAGRATSAVKAAAFRVLDEHGVPTAALVNIAADFLARKACKAREEEEEKKTAKPRKKKGAATAVADGS